LLLKILWQRVESDQRTGFLLVFGVFSNIALHGFDPLSQRLPEGSNAFGRALAAQPHDDCVVCIRIRGCQRVENLSYAGLQVARADLLCPQDQAAAGCRTLGFLQLGHVDRNYINTACQQFVQGPRK
jgi:hypothetical protein